MTRRVLVVEEHALVAVGLQFALSGRCWEIETTSGPTASDMIDHAQRFKPQCVLLDIHFGTGVAKGIEFIGALRSTGTKVVVLTSERRRMVLAECIEAGAACWISRGASLDEVDATLGHVLDGQAVLGRTDRAALLDELQLERAGTLSSQAIFAQLTTREARVLGALIDGLCAEEIAAAQFVALSTVRSQIRSVLGKLGVRSQLAAVALAVAHAELLPHSERAANRRRRTHSLSLIRCGPDFRQ